MKTWEALPLFSYRPQPSNEDEQAIEAHLLTCEPRHQTRLSIAIALGWKPSQATWRRMRAACKHDRDTDCSIISAPGRPFTHALRSTFDEIMAAANAFGSQADEMKRNQIALARRAHGQKRRD